MDGKIEQVFAVPVVEEFAQHHETRDVLARLYGAVWQGAVAHGARGHEVPCVALRALGREEDLEGAVGLYVQRCAVEHRAVGARAGRHLAQFAGISRVTARRLEDHVVRRFAACGRGRLAAPVAGVGCPPANAVGVVAVDGGAEVDRVGVVDGRAVQRLDRAYEIRVLWRGADASCNRAIEKAQHVAVALGEVARVGGRWIQRGGVYGIARFAERSQHLLPCGAQFLCGGARVFVVVA